MQDDSEQSPGLSLGLDALDLPLLLAGPITAESLLALPDLLNEVQLDEANFYQSLSGRQDVLAGLIQYCIAPPLSATSASVQLALKLFDAMSLGPAILAAPQQPSFARLREFIEQTEELDYSAAGNFEILMERLVRFNRQAVRLLLKDSRVALSRHISRRAVQGVVQTLYFGDSSLMSQFLQIVLQRVHQSKNEKQAEWLCKGLLVLIRQAQGEHTSRTFRMVQSLAVLSRVFIRTSQRTVRSMLQVMAAGVNHRSGRQLGQALAHHFNGCRSQYLLSEGSAKYLPQLTDLFTLLLQIEGFDYEGLWPVFIAFQTSYSANDMYQAAFIRFCSAAINKNLLVPQIQSLLLQMNRNREPASMFIQARLIASLSKARTQFCEQFCQQATIIKICSQPLLQVPTVKYNVDLTAQQINLKLKQIFGTSIQEEADNNFQFKIDDELEPSLPETSDSKVKLAPEAEAVTKLDEKQTIVTLLQQQTGGGQILQPPLNAHGQGNSSNTASNKPDKQIMQIENPLPQSAMNVQAELTVSQPINSQIKLSHQIQQLLKQGQKKQVVCNSDELPLESTSQPPQKVYEPSQPLAGQQ